MKKRSIWFTMGGAILLIALGIMLAQILLNRDGSPNSSQDIYPTSITATPPAPPSSSGVEEDPAAPMELPTEAPTAPPAPSLDAVRDQLAPFDQQMQEFDSWIEKTEPERLDGQDCRSCIGQARGECSIYSTGIGNVVFVEGYTYRGPSNNVYIYDMDGDERPELLKWDLNRDSEFDVIEYDINEDGTLDFALADTNANGQFDEDEMYMHHPTTQRWRPMVPGALPFPILPVFPY